jgi:hypothetical protein
LLEADGENQLEKSLGPKNPFELVDEVADGEEGEEHRTRIFPASKNQIMNGKVGRKCVNNYFWVEDWKEIENG